MIKGTISFNRYGTGKSNPDISSKLEIPTKWFTFLLKDEFGEVRRTFLRFFSN
jgi:hypothetical protein